MKPPCTIARLSRPVAADVNVETKITAHKPTSGSRMLYDRKEAARQLSISIRSLDYLIADKTFRTIRIGKKVMIPYGELVGYASSNHYDRIVPVGRSSGVVSPQVPDPTNIEPRA